MWRMTKILGIGTAVWIGAGAPILLFPATSLFLFLLIVKITAAAATITAILVAVSASIVFPILATHAIGELWRKKQQRRELIVVLANDAPYQAAFKAGGKKMMITLAFCELFVAHCLEVCVVERPGEPKREYRLKDEVDISLLDGMERIVARNLITYRSFSQLCAVVSAQIGRAECRRYFKGRRPSESSLVEESYRGGLEQLADRYERILFDAMDHCRAEIACGV